MGFINEDDYKLQIRDFDLDDLTDYTTDIRLKSELVAQAEMESYLKDRYNVGIVFGQTADDRNPLVVMYMIDISLYHIFSALPGRMMPQLRDDRYRAAKKWLDMVREGDLNPGLPANTDKDGDKTIDSFFGSNFKNGYSW